MKKLLALILSCTLILGSLAGCSKNPDPTPGNTSDPPPVATDENKPADSTPAPAADPGTPVYGGELKIALNRTINAEALDPTLANSTTCDQVCLQYGDTLVQETADAVDYLPSLATDWTISEDGKVYTFTIREGVHFQKGKYQDGRELTAEDVAWSLNRAHEESWWGYLPFFDHAEVQDGKVVCYLENANATFLHELTSTSGIIVPKEEVEGWGDQFGSHPISTGPFIVSEHVPDQYTKLVKNPNYWGVEPYLDAVTYYVITDEAQAMNALTTGEVDVVLTVSGNYIQQVRDNPNLVLSQTPESRLSFLGFNLSDSVLSDKRVRDAISMAIDRKQIADGVYANGDGAASYLPVPITSWGYDPALEELVPAYDIDAAKALLAEAGYGNGLNLVLTVGTADAYVRAATIIQAMLSQIGVNVEIQSLSSTEVTDRYLNNTVQLFIGGQGGSADPGTFVGNFLSTAKLHTNFNAFCYSDPATDEIVNQAGAETDRAKRTELYHELIKEALDTNIGVFYATSYLSWGLGQRVHGYVQENKSVMRVCGLEGTGINIWVTE